MERDVNIKLVRMVLRKFGEKKPVLGEGVYVDEDAVVVGDVRLKDKASVWPGAVLRADDDYVEIGRGSAVLDLAFAEAPRGRPVVVGDRCIVSHGARLHGCRIGDECIIGVGAIVLDNATVGERSIVAAGSLVPPGTRIQAESFVMGVPCKVARGTSAADMGTLNEELKALAAKALKYASQR